MYYLSGRFLAIPFTVRRSQELTPCLDTTDRAVNYLSLGVPSPQCRLNYRFVRVISCVIERAFQRIKSSRVHRRYLLAPLVNLRFFPRRTIVRYATVETNRPDCSRKEQVLNSPLIDSADYSIESLSYQRLPLIKISLK